MSLLELDKQIFVAEVANGLTSRQARVAATRAPFVACHPGRRAGKTWAIPRLALLACTRAPGGDIVLGAETKLKAKTLFWGGLLQFVKGRSGWTVNAAEGWVQSPWGPTIRLWGIKDDGAVALLRGLSLLEAHFDEVASYAQRLRVLIDDVVEPMLGEWRHYPGGGRCFLWGTPSYTRIGAWYEICSGERGWDVHHWTVLENEHYPDPGGYLAGVRDRHGWTEEEPTYRREYLGEFVDDAGRLVVAYSRDVLVDAMPVDYDPLRWEHTLAVDFGVEHQTAWALIASDPAARSPQLYLVHVQGHTGLLLDDASAITHDYVDRYRVVQLLGDAHGLGKPYVEAWNRIELAPIKMEPAKKEDKRGWIEVLNDDLRTGRLRVVEHDCGGWIDEVSSLPWDDRRLEPAPGYPDDCMHAALYAYRHHRAYLRLDRTPPEERVSTQTAIERRLDAEALRERDRPWHDR